jgi:magnesium and cobalt exporter, CNNM family
LRRAARFWEAVIDVYPLLWVVLATTALSGYFALMSCVLRGFRRLQLEEAFPGPAGQKRLADLETRLKSLRLTAGFARAVANLVLVVVCVHFLTSLDAEGSWRPVVLGTCISAGLIAVFGIAIPQAWSSYAGEKVLARTWWLMTVSRWVLSPATWVMRAFDLPVRRLSGVGDEEDDNGEIAKQEILQAATEGHAEGAVDADEVQMIESVMELGETRAGEIMTPRTDIFALAAETPWEDACGQVIEAGHTRVPVYDGDIDNIVGVLYAKDLLAHVIKKETHSLREVMRKPYFVPETKPLDDLLREFQARKVHLAVALDEYGGTSGVVTIEDVLEEIVGDITDEYDEVAPELLLRLDDQVVEADGRLHIDELNDEMHLGIPEDEDYDTVAGLVYTELGYIPITGETLSAHGARFTVLDADDRKIIRLRVEREQQTAEEVI